MELHETLRRAVNAKLKTMSLSALAKDAGVPYGSLYAFVHDDKGLTLATASKLCRYLGLTLKGKNNDASD